ncbi:hypothetical protein WJX73_001910 [Symbiochloris irregularis]|uniref:sn-1-specific diacylglycerol lipase n=1 Tax=Symbiochloris irregularis TaxID=706552 RepID=A0AAW1NTH2_9CHLO
MPSVKLFGRSWDTTTDVLPVNFLAPMLLHVSLVIAAIASVIGRSEEGCPDNAAQAAYQALRWSLFGFFVLSATAEMGTVIFGLQGTPLEESKRRFAVPCVYAIMGLYVLELIIAIYGTILINTVNPPCTTAHAVRIVVYMSWAKLAFTIFWLVTCYAFFPATFDDAQGWIERIKWLFSLLQRVGIRLGDLPGATHGMKEEEEPDDGSKTGGMTPPRDQSKRKDGHEVEKLKEQRKKGSREEQLMHHLAATFRMILGDIDLTVTDRHVALVLAGSLQIMRRRNRVERYLLPKDKWRLSEEQEEDLEKQENRAEVSADLLKESLVFLEYANASYYIEGPMDPEEARLQREKEVKKRRRTCCFIALPNFMQREDARVEHASLSRRRGGRKKGKGGPEVEASAGSMVDGAGDEHDITKGATGELDFDDPHKNMDIVYRKADNVVLGQLPYCIALDWKRQLVVLSCRGTSSLRDAVTDAIGQPIDLGLWLSPEGDEAQEELPGFGSLGTQCAHSGVLTAAAATYKDLQRHRILEELLQTSDIPDLPAQDELQGHNQPRAHADGGQTTQDDDQSSTGSYATARGSRQGSTRQSLEATEHRMSNGDVPGSSQPSMRSGADAAEPEMDHQPSRRTQDMHAELEKTVAEGQEMVEKLVSASTAPGGGDSTPLPPEAKAEEERQMGKLRARKLDCKGWGLITTGHSLGGGVAALLALKLRARFPKTHCWAFCPPGGLVTAGLAHAMEPFCTSVALGKDGVPRASLHTMARLMDDAVEGLARGKRCKMRVLVRNVRKAGRAKLLDMNEFHALGSIPAEPQAALDKYRKSREQTKDLMGMATFPAGKLMYIRRLKFKDGSTSYDAVWIKPESLMTEGFLISGRMLKDHLLSSVQQGLEGAIERSEGGPGKEEDDGSDDSDATPGSVARLCFSCHPRTAMTKVKRIHRRHKEEIKTAGAATKGGQIAHMASAVDGP